MYKEATPYQLTLSDGSVWHFDAAAPLRPWRDRLARIMTMTPASRDATHRIFFAQRGEDGGVPQEALDAFGATPNPEDGWRSFDVGTAFRGWQHPGRTEMLVALNTDLINHEEVQYIAMWSALRLIHGHAIRQGGGPFHCTYATLDGKAVLIAAAANTGKSTCYRRLPAHWRPVSDDMALLLPAGNAVWNVHPMPTWSDYLWRDSTQAWACSECAPLAAIFFLRQGTEDQVSPVDQREAYAAVLRGVKQVAEAYWNRIDPISRREQAEHLFTTARDIVAAVPTYRLDATLDGRFWEPIETVLG